jgi:hypothetical protein
MLDSKLKLTTLRKLIELERADLLGESRGQLARP